MVRVPGAPGHANRYDEDTIVARAMWKGAIQFGLVTIPIKLYLATESKSGISFNLLHATDNSRIQMKVWCPVDEQMIERSETVRGYEYAPGEYVVITDEDLANVPLKTVRSIEIEQFVPRDESQGAVRFVKQAYYVEPDRIGRKAFALLREVLAEQRLTAICKVVIKDREALAALDPFEGTMMLSTLHWPDEIRAVDELDLGEESFEFKPAEKAMAAQLVAAMTGVFDPAEYRDEYREAVRAVIEAKIEGHEAVAAPEAETGGKLIDLMAALEASVKAASAARAAAEPAPVSVADAKQARAGRAGEAAATDAAQAAVTPEAAAEIEAAAPRPARKRRTA
jgi:DNA end-binding protein Ku